MIEVRYSLVIEATEEPDYFGFYSPDLEGFSGIDHSVEDCLFKAKWGMKEHVDLLKEQNLPVPQENPDPTIIIQNEKKLAVARSVAEIEKEELKEPPQVSQPFLNLNSPVYPCASYRMKRDIQRQPSWHSPQ